MLLVKKEMRSDELMSFYWKARTLISGDYREMERNLIAYHNKKVIEKYKGKEEIYCVSRLFTDEGGLFCIFLKAIAGISYSVQNGFIPVIDMQTKENIFLSKKERKKINAWELFFNQPAGVSFEDIKNKPNKIILENPLGPSNLFELAATPDMTHYWRILCDKYTPFSKEVEAVIEKYADMFQPEDRVLGVLARGTDYLNPGVGHPVQPSTEEVIRRAKESMERNQCSKVFVATEDDNILKAMQEEFGDSLLYVDQKRYQGMQADKLGHLTDYRNDAIEMNRSYLAAMYFLSKCNCFFGGVTTGTIGVYLLSEGFEQFEFWYRGSHGTSDSKTLDINKL